MSVSWILKMAWRDSRGSRRRLLLFLSSMVLGVGALVAIQALGTSLQQAVDSEARTLLGADLVLENEQPFPAPIEALADSLGGEQARRTSFASMVYFPTQEGTRLATVRATEPGYPFYGVVETTPPGAADLYHDGDRALVDAALMRQFGVAVGDSVRVGQRLYEVAGQIDKTTSESGAISFVSPLVYIPYARLDTTLTQQGSRVEYEWYFRLDDSVDPEALRSDIRPLLRENQVGSDTVGERAEDWSEGLSNLYRFLGLVGFVALLLGGLGVASAVHVYVKQRIETVAVLRCLGASGPSTFSIYLTQAAAMGLLSGTLGTLIGVGLQLYLPRLVQDILPIQIDFLFSWSAVALGLGVGLGTTLLFALLPLLTVRRVSPLRAIRAAYEAQDQGPDPLRWVVYGLIGLAIGVFAVAQAPQPALGIGFAVGIGVVFGLLALTAQGLILLVRRFFPSGWPYAWRQGLANLYRPNNQTLILMLSLGLGTFLIMTLWLSQQVLLDQIQVAGGEGRPDLVLFDVQPDQQPGVREAIEAQALPVLAEVPIVTMRLAAINGRTVEELREDPNTPTSWAHRREYRSSYREALTDSETLVAGSFVGTVEPGAAYPPVSVEQDVANELNVSLGDTLVWNVQGVDIPTVVGSFRTVDWQRFSTNFFVIFPAGVLEEAPQFYVMLTRTETAEASAAVQAAVVQRYPNVSAIDLSLVLSVFDEVFGRIAFAIRFMALFSILTGLIVLAGAVIVSRVQRISESVLLKTLGASRGNVYRIMLAEYLFLGLLATLTGLVLAVAGSALLAVFAFDAPFTLPPLPLLVALLVVTGLTVGIGLFNSRGIYDRPPLEVLRAEA